MAINKIYNDLQAKLSIIPKKPGVYLFLNKEEKIIYVGKAKNLFNRVGSYFTKKHDSRKQELLVKNITDIKYVVVENEYEALLLENNFIKKHQPKFNIKLKDDKTFPWICVTKEEFPKIFYTRKPDPKKGIYFGPYTSVNIVKVIIKTLRKSFYLRTCYLNLTEENISAHKFKLCLEYHLKNCKAPCENLQSKQEYNANIEMAKNILRGDLQEVLAHLKIEMNILSERLKFEEAQVLKENIETLENYYSKSVIINTANSDMDVFSYYPSESMAYVNYMKVVKGAIIQSWNLEIINTLDEEKEEILPTVIAEIRSKFESSAKEIILPFEIEFLTDIKLTVPKSGEKKKILELSERNAKQFAIERRSFTDKIKQKREDKSLGVLISLQKILSLPHIPKNIECFDNSNTQGTNPVASCVVFKNAKPSKKDYRHYNIKTVIGADDFASMEEVILRRYRRLLDDSEQLPDLIIVDGGKGQLNAAVNSLKKLGIYEDVSIISIAKKLEDVFIPGNSEPILIGKKEPALKLIQQLRDEAHRFGLRFHRQKRSNNMIISEFNTIDGIGEKTFAQLIEAFKTIEEIKKASFEELSNVVGNSKAQKIKNYYKA